MSDRPVYLETWGLWSYEGPHNDPRDLKTGTHGASICIGSIRSAADDQKHECLATMCADSEERAEDRARLAAAAPAMARCLLLSEWEAVDGQDSDAFCSVCRAWHCTGARHEENCQLDASLTAAGLPDQRSRDEARQRIGEERSR